MVVFLGGRHMQTGTFRIKAKHPRNNRSPRAGRVSGPAAQNDALQALANRLDNVGQIDQYLVMALHVAHLDLAGGKLVAAQDQNELGAHLVGLLKLSLSERP